MILTDDEIEIIKKIYFHIAPKIVLSIQNYNGDYEFRELYITGIESKQPRKYLQLYINVENITPWQLKTFEKRSKKELPNMAYIEKHGNIIRLGFKK